MLDLTRFKISNRFLVMVGTAAVIIVVFFVGFAQYALQVSEQQFEQRATMLAETMAAESVHELLMNDSAGLEEGIERRIEQEMVVAGAFFGADEELLVERNLDALPEIDDQGTASEQTLYHTETEAGAPVIVTQTPVERNLGTDDSEVVGSVALAMPAQTLQSQTQTSYTIIALISLGVIGIAWGMHRMVNRTIARPANRLREAAQSVEDQNFDTSVEVDQDDELGELASSFNAMVAQIRSAVHEMEERSEEAKEARARAEKAREEVESQQQSLQGGVNRMLEAMERFADGDLTVRVDVNRSDALGQLFEGFNRAAGNIQQMLNRVAEAVEMTTSTADQISSASEQLAAGAHEQAEQADEVAAAMEQMSRTIVENAQTATETASVAEDNRETARENGEVIMEAVTKMEEIGAVVQDSTETVGRLRESSEEIGEIVETIDEIADQTNLLALNAAIEAARAGEHGDGFAVVADEVRQLAERTAEATDEIAEMIETVQEETQAAVEAMEDGKREVEIGIELAGEAGDAFEEIVGGAEEITDRVDNIAAATEQQSTTSEQISESVQSISTVSAESVEGVEEVANAAGELNRLTNDLKDYVDQFTVDGTASSGQSTSATATAKEDASDARSEAAADVTAPLANGNARR